MSKRIKIIRYSIAKYAYVYKMKDTIDMRYDSGSIYYLTMIEYYIKAIYVSKNQGNISLERNGKRIESFESWAYYYDQILEAAEDYIILIENANKK